MRCKKHLTDLSSGVGVCATCLRERLFALIAAQERAQNQAQAQAQALEVHRNSDPLPPPLVFPRSVSPYIGSRKSEESLWNRHRLQNLSDQRFHSTPLVGPNGAIVAAGGAYKKKSSRFSLFKNLFRSKSDKVDTDHRVPSSNPPDSSPAASSAPTWFSSIIPRGRQKQSRLFSVDQSTITRGRRHGRHRDRGMSPVRYPDDGAGEDECHGGSSGYSSESPNCYKQTPVRATPQNRRGGGGRPNHSRNVSGLAFCLSPLVRASPNRQWNQKAMPPEMTIPGEVRAPVKPHLSTAASFCANRSRKLADFGRSNHNH